ncbi:hypothetical protein [Azospirillum sp. A39]|uniref:hypothetical protein n=1 Tax=Azospirillum sp. A39 TaxID=3462279 RepID=UPI00404605E5
MTPRRDRNIGTPVRKSLAVAVLAGGAAALAGCSGLGGPDSPADLALACPQVSIVRDLQVATQFRGNGRDMTDIASRAVLADYSGNCEYDSNGVTVNVTVALVAERGPAMTGETATYPYFVAVLPPGQAEPREKAIYDAAMAFKAGTPRAAVSEEVAVAIPVGKDANAKDWTVLLGFQLTPEQLRYNLSATGG